jgi:2-(1,2-epoxy-1,2-dihydrophenyl)acetyl-CoA isomerase
VAELRIIGAQSPIWRRGCHLSGGDVEYEEIRYETRGPIAAITLDRPKRLNAWTPRMAREQWHAIERANEDPAIGAIVMTGAGRGFCAGADIGGFQDQIESHEELSIGGDWVELCRRSKPLIAAVNGACVGVGMTMILPFDIIVASERARFGMFFIKMGVVPELASTHFLVQRVGFAKASEMCLSGRLYSASELSDHGLLNGVVPPDELVPRCEELANEIAANPDPQLRMIKDLLTRNGTEPDLKAVQAREQELLKRCYETPEHEEAVSAFMQRRQPRFR